MIAFNSDHVLPQVLEAVLPFGLVIATEGPVKYWQGLGHTTSTDQTNAILDRYGINTLHGQWREKDEMVNAGLERIHADTEFVWVLDADEVWDPGAIKKVLSLLEQGLDSMSFKANSFYGGFERCMGGFEENFEVHRIQRWYPGARWATHRPPTVLAPDGHPWRAHRHLGHNATSALGLRYFHYSYVFPLQMQGKAAYYADMDPAGNIPLYFERVYLPWVRASPAKRQKLEEEYQGVHNWLPARRGPTFTYPFEQRHPESIEKALPYLRQRFTDELALFTETVKA